MAATPFRPLYQTGTFMTCTIKVNTTVPGWEKTVRSVLRKIHGIRAFDMDEYGFIQVSGLVHPELIINKLAQAGKPAVLCSMRYEDCSSSLRGPNTNMPFRSTWVGNDYDYYTPEDHLYVSHAHGRYGSSAGYYGYNRPFARLANELSQGRAWPPPPPPLDPRHTVYVPRYIEHGPGCCSLM